MSENESKRINLRIKKEAYERIKENAEKNNLSMNIYLQKIAMDGFIINNDYSYFDEYVTAFADVRKSIDLLTLSVLNTSEFYPQDLENIYLVLEELLNNQKKIYRQITNENKKIRKNVIGLMEKGEKNDC